MKLQFVSLDKLSISRTNMRHSRRAPDVSDILPSVRRRGVIQPIIIRANGSPELFEIVAGARRFTAAKIVAEERRAEGGEAEPLPCAILETSDDADAVEASLIENLARLDADEVTQWVTFTRLVKEGRSVEDIAATFGLPDLAIKRVLALGNLLPRIRTMYADEEIDRTTVRLLTLASKRQQQDWLKLADDIEARTPTGSQVKAWLLGGQSIPVGLALFDVEASGLATIGDLFGEDRLFADASAFWTAQDAAIVARRDAYLADGWSEVLIVPRDTYFQSWEYEKRPKRKGGRIYIDVRTSGEVTFHEGYVARREAERARRGGEAAAADTKPQRPEVTAAMQTYVDLHRHAAARAALADHPGVALRAMLAHAIIGSPLWSVRREPQASRDEATAESVETSIAETRFDERRRAVLALLRFDADKPTVSGGNGDDRELAGLFLRLLDLPDPAILDVVAIVMGETLAAGSVASEAIGRTLGVDMADYWSADPAFFDLVRDKEVLGAMIAEVAGKTVATANAKEKGATLKRIIADHLEGRDGRTKVERWVPRWMAFPPAAYTARGGVGSVRAYVRLVSLDGQDGADRAPEPRPDADDKSGTDGPTGGVDEEVSDREDRLAA